MHVIHSIFVRDINGVLCAVVYIVLQDVVCTKIFDVLLWLRWGVKVNSVYGGRDPRIAQRDCLVPAGRVVG